MKKVIVSKNKCIGCFACEDATDGLFKVTDGLARIDQKADLKDPKIQEKIKLAIEVGPTRAISEE